MKVLDHGEVDLIDSAASDQSVLRAMLVSTDKDLIDTNLMLDYGGTVPYGDRLRADIDKQIARNKGRINYLMREHHGTPFEHNFFCFRVTAPIFVLREWHRHRIGWSYNEQSGRYMELGDKWYIPNRQDIRTRVGSAGHYVYELMMHSVGGDELITSYLEDLRNTCQRDYLDYKAYIAEGVAPEQARLLLHVNHYSSMYATCNARSLMHFLALRANPTAQWEIQQYADALEKFFAEAMPVTYEAFVNNGRVAP